MVLSDYLGTGMPCLINIEHAHVVVFGLHLRLLVDLRSIEQAAKLSVCDCVAEVGVEPVIEGLLALFEGEST